MTNEEVAAAINDWRQGDVILGAIDLPLLDKGADGDEVVVEPTEGALLLTQSCDIIRNYDRKPFLHIAALVPVGEEDMRRIAAGREIRYLHVPVLTERMLVADLDRTATIDKRILVGRERLVGCNSDTQRRELAASIARHRQRFAFPNEFNDALKPLRRWVERGAGKNSDNGRFIDAIQEIRVTTLSWDSPDELEFICVIPDGIPPEVRENWLKTHIPSLEERVATDWCRECTFRISTLLELSAAEYLDSDRLDFDGLSDA